jgi:hypothetical protein
VSSFTFGLFFFKYVGFEVVTKVVMKNYIFCDIKPCSLLRIDRSFGGIFCVDLQGEKDGAICSSETSVDATDYTALSPRK